MKLVPILFLLLSGCFQTTPYQKTPYQPTPYQPSNPQNTKNSYSPETTPQQYAKDHRCIKSSYLPVKAIKTTSEYEAIGAFNITASFYSYDLSCQGLEEAFSFCKNTDRSIDNCVAGLMYSSGYSSTDEKNAEIRRVELDKITTYSKLINVQVTNLSTGATSGGARLGSVLSQASYIDSSNWKNYSATTQVGVGLLGAIAGSMLDSQSVTKYKVTYFLQMPNGDVKQVEKTQATETHIPAGVCVAFREPNTVEMANQNECENIKK